jgi:hypothetical protein
MQSVHSCEAMSLRSTVSQSVRAPRGAWCSAAAWTMLLLLLSACSAVASASASASQPAVRLPASSSGVCQAITALPDLSAAARAFTNLAHDALHGLAADARLDRSMAARILEAMAKVHADFARSPDVALLKDDLTTLLAATDRALEALGVQVPPCAK